MQYGNEKIIWRNIYIKETDELISFEQIEIQIFLFYDSKAFD